MCEICLKKCVSIFEFEHAIANWFDYYCGFKIVGYSIRINYSLIFLSGIYLLALVSYLAYYNLRL